MSQISQDYNLNLQDTGVPVVVHVVQYDSEYRTLRFTLYNGTEIFDVPSDTSVTIRGTKPDGYGFSYAMTVHPSTASIVYVALREQMTAVAGDVACEVRLTDADDRVMAAFPFVLRVTKAAFDDDTVVSDSDIAYAASVLSQLQSVSALKSQVDENTDDITALETEDTVLQAQIDQLVAPSGEAPSAAEVLDARIGTDAYTYSTLGGAIRSQVSGLDESKQTRLATYVGVSGTATTSALWNSNTGAETSMSSENYAYLRIMSGFTPGKVYAFSGQQATNVDYSFVTFYATSMVRISRVVPDTAVNDHVLIRVPEGTVRIYVNGAGTMAPAMYRVDYADADLSQIDTLRDDVDELQSDIEDKQDKAYAYTDVAGTLTTGLWRYDTHAASTNEDYAYLVVSSGFTAGQKYAFSGKQPSNTSAFAGVVFYNSSMARIGIYQPDTGDFVKQILVVPENTAHIYINGSSGYSQVPEMCSISDLGVNLEYLQYESDNLCERRRWDGQYLSFIRKPLDHLIVTFTIDDSHADISDIADAFITADVPLCLATIPGYLAHICNDGTTVKAVCTRVEAAGGEILCHNSFVIDADTTEAEYFKYFVASKKTLTDAGFSVRGIVKSGGGSDDPKIGKCKYYLRSYYDYGCGFSYIDDARYSNGRVAMTEDIASLKARVDAAASGGIIHFYAHGESDMGSGYVSKVMELVSYIQNTANAEITTVGEAFTDNFVPAISPVITTGSLTLGHGTADATKITAAQLRQLLTLI